MNKPLFNFTMRDEWHILWLLFLQHVLSVGNYLVYVRFSLKEDSNNIWKISFSDDQIFKWFIIILKPPFLSLDCFVVKTGWTRSICWSGMCLFIHQAALCDQAVHTSLWELKNNGLASMWSYITSSSALSIMRTGHSGLQGYIR